MSGPYRVSTNATGHHSWWCDGDPIPPDHTAIRPASPLEAAFMDEIVKCPSTPSRVLADRLRHLIQPPPGFADVVGYLHTAGLRVVPAEPTRAMYAAGRHAVVGMTSIDHDVVLIRAWRAMLEAAPGPAQ